MIKMKSEAKFRFVFKNGYTHDFWFTKLDIEWNSVTKELTAVKWSALKRNNELPFHFMVNDIATIIDLGKSRSRIAWGD